MALPVLSIPSEGRGAGTQSAWLYDLLRPHVDELVVTSVRGSRGPKSDAKDAYGLAEKLRLGGLDRIVYKAPSEFRALRQLAVVHRALTGDLVRVRLRIKSQYRSRGISSASSRDGTRRSSTGAGGARPQARAGLRARPRPRVRERGRRAAPAAEHHEPELQTCASGFRKIKPSLPDSVVDLLLQLPRPTFLTVVGALERGRFAVAIG